MDGEDGGAGCTLSSPPAETPELQLIMRKTTHTSSLTPALGPLGPAARRQAPTLPAGGLALAVSPSFIHQWTGKAVGFPGPVLPTSGRSPSPGA